MRSIAKFCLLGAILLIAFFHQSCTKENVAPKAPRDISKDMLGGDVSGDPDQYNTWTKPYIHGVQMTLLNPGSDASKGTISFKYRIITDSLISVRMVVMNEDIPTLTNQSPLYMKYEVLPDPQYTDRKWVVFTSTVKREYYEINFTRSYGSLVSGVYVPKAYAWEYTRFLVSIKSKSTQTVPFKQSITFYDDGYLGQ